MGAARRPPWDMGDAPDSQSRGVAMEFIFAYIDPGSGSLVIQALIAGIVALPIFFRRQIARFVHSVRGDGHEEEARNDRDDSATREPEDAE